MKDRNKVIPKSVGLKKRQLEFIKYCDGKTFKIDEHRVIFKADKFFRDVMDLQIEIIAEKYTEVKKFL